MAQLTASNASRPPELNPVAGDEFLQQQRGASTSPAAAATRYKAAVAQARALVSPPRPSAAGSAAPAGTSFSGQTWSPLGPAPATTSFYGGKNSGRVRGLAVVSGATDKVVLGSAGGGVWTATVANATPAWTTHTDTQTDLAIGAVAVDPTYPTYLYAGTGESSGCIDCYPGLGILESTNGGASWTLHNPTKDFTGAAVSALVVEKGSASASSATVLAGTSNGLYVSTDGGTSWAKEAATSWTTGPVTSLVVNTTVSPPVVYAAVKGVGIEKGSTNGANWSVLTTGASALPTTGATAVALGIGATASSTTTVLYASFGRTSGGYGGMWKSTNGGGTWAKETSVPDFTTPSYAYTNKLNGTATGDQGWYDNVVAVDPATHTVVVAAGIAAVGSKDGGSTWFNLNGGHDYYATPPAPNLFHPDFHALTFDAAGNLYLGNDGGVWEMSAAGVKSPTTVTAADFTNLNDGSLDITQFYANLAQASTGAKILGGAQDNGTSYYTGSVAWKNVLSGDGGDDLIDPAKATVQFGEADQSLSATSNAWGSTTTLVTPKKNTTHTAWVPPLALSKNATTPTEPTVFYGETAGVLRLTSPLGTVTKKKLAVGTGQVVALAVAPTNPTVLYAGFTGGAVFYTTNALAATPTFHQVTGTGSAPYSSWVTHIAVDPATAGQILFSTSTGMVQNKPTMTPQVVQVTGADTATPAPTLTQEAGDLPKTSTNSIVYDNGQYLVATDVGVFSAPSLAGGTTHWSKVGTGLPNVQVIGLTLTTNGSVLAATHGRGAWKLAAATTTPAKLAFSAQPPSTTTTGTAFTVEVAVENAAGATVPSGTTVTLSLSQAGKALTTGLTCTGVATGTASKKPVAGVATFSCSVGVVGTTYRLTATDHTGAITPATSSVFSVTANRKAGTPAMGYEMVASDGGVFTYGTAGFFGSMGGKPLNAPIVGIAANPNGKGYWEVASDGGIFAFGTAPFYGSMGGKPLNAPIVGIAANPNGAGYWEVASDGGIFAFGTAPFYGSMGGKPLNKPIVGLAATPYGGGYWEVASDGGVFTFGAATFQGSMGGKPLNAPIVAIAATPFGLGYWEVASDGGIFSFGTAPFYGSMGGKPMNAPVVALAATPSGNGFYEVASDGGIFAFGTAPFYGSMGGKPLNKPIVGIAAIG